MHDETKARQNLKKKWRYTLRQAQKEGVAIELANSQDGFCAAATLLNELETKKGFVSPLGARFFWEVFKDARESEAYRLHVARAGEEIVAVHLGSYVGETSVYLIGAANEAARRLNASYLLHWRAVQETIARGMRWYDLGGIDPRSNPSGYQFKKGMNGIEIAEVGAFDCSPDFLRGKSVELLESLARSLRGRMRAAGMSRRDGAATA
jgi:lipid II:glycine glycyltransferase (peptidoglycan interpeptide bridge formation enzyme)